MPVEGRGGRGVGAHVVEEVAAVLVHEVVDVDCFVLFPVFVRSLGCVDMDIDRDGDVDGDGIPS